VRGDVEVARLLVPERSSKFRQVADRINTRLFSHICLANYRLLQNYDNGALGRDSCTNRPSRRAARAMTIADFCAFNRIGLINARLRSPLVRIAAIAAIHGVALLAIYRTEAKITPLTKQRWLPLWKTWASKSFAPTAATNCWPDLQGRIREGDPRLPE